MSKSLVKVRPNSGETLGEGALPVFPAAAFRTSERLFLEHAEEVASEFEDAVAVVQDGDFDL